MISINAQNKEIKLNFAGFGKLDMAAFKLSAETKIKISGSGAYLQGFEDSFEDEDGNYWSINENTDLLVYGWILNSSTRKVVWSLKDFISAGKRDLNGIFKFEQEKTLPAGEYEAYFTAMFDHEHGIAFGKEIWRKLLAELSGADYNIRVLQKTNMIISAPSGSFSETNVEGVVDRNSSKAIVSLIRVGDDKKLNKGFSLKGDTRLKIYALGEIRDNNKYDHAWIYDVSRNIKVWDMNSNNSSSAGGSKKNMMFNNEITLPKGSYIVHYVSDDNHSFESWNSLPPGDPQYWGITVRAVSEADQANVMPFNSNDIVKPVVELVKVGDDAFLSQGFTLDKETKLRVLVIGESSGGDMADGGWIIDVDTRKTIWKMEYNKTEHAGGARKNRMIDEEITLKKGSYIAFYSTDDSHSYGDWNANPPYDEDRYGLTIWTVNEADAAGIKLFDEKDYKSPGVIAEIVRVKDNDFESRSFTLDKETKIRIYAIGEGVHGGMADYGWIEDDATGKAVWEMTYKKTQHAGGAEKNRLVNEVITLPKGKYRIYYETDNSHSYKDWNSSPPDDQERYGITLMYEER